jgi:hypothetical protein
LFGAKVFELLLCSTTAGVEFDECVDDADILAAAAL